MSLLRLLLLKHFIPPERAEMSAQEYGGLLRFLPSRLKQDSSPDLSATPFLHHSGITNYLNRSLAEAGQTQSEMQEERIKRQTERTRTLGSGATLEGLVPAPVSAPQMASSSSTRSWLGDAASNIAATILLPSTTNNTPNKPAFTPQLQTPTQQEEWDDDEYDDIELSSSQIQQFETENANILRSVQDTLASVEKAESRLQEIAALQTELVTHLTQQSDMIDQIYEDTVVTTETVEPFSCGRRNDARRMVVYTFSSFLLGLAFHSSFCIITKYTLHCKIPFLPSHGIGIVDAILYVLCIRRLRLNISKKRRPFPCLFKSIRCQLVLDVRTFFELSNFLLH